MSRAGNSTLTRTQQLQTRLIAATGAPIISAVCRTIRWKVEGLHYYDEAVRSGPPPILAFWHGRILPAMWVFRNRGIVVMASANFDGQWIAQIIERFGYRTVAGSTSRRGARALLEMKREVERGHPVAFTLDGPRGPARVAQPGAVWLAGATGSPILPFHAEANRCWTANSWDRTQVPKAFSTVILSIHRPIVVPGTGTQQLKEGGLALSAALADTETETLAAHVRAG